MKRRRIPANSDRRRVVFLAAVILLQALCALFFITDATVDIATGEAQFDIHLVVEAAASVALILGVFYLTRELRMLLSRMNSLEIGLSVARGELAQVVATFFDRWDLSRSEREVARLVLQGFDNESIAEIRGTANGTVRAQTSSIYAKAGVESRAHLLSVFVRDLLDDREAVSPGE